MTMRASIIDYPRKQLDEAIWAVDGQTISLQPNIEQEIKNIVQKFLTHVDLSRRSVKDILIYGSILTNQWNSKTDIDARILLDPDFVHRGMTGDDLFELSKDILHGTKVGGTQHPFNATVVIDGEQTELGRHSLGLTDKDPVFSLRTGKVKNFGNWNDEKFDPDVEFKEEKKSAEELMEYLDNLIHNAKTQTIDIELLKEAISNVNNPNKIISKLEEKINQLTNTIFLLVKEYEELKSNRSEGYESAPENIDHHKMPQNIIYKILDKYKYIDVMKKLKSILKNGIQPQEIKTVEKVLNVEGAVDTRPISGVSPTAPPTSLTGPPGDTEINMQRVPDGGMMHGASCPHCGYMNPLTAAKEGKELTCQGCGKRFEMSGGENGTTDFFLNTAPSTEQLTAPYESDVPVYSRKGQVNLSVQDLDSLKTMLKDLGVSNDVLTKLDNTVTTPQQQNPVEPTQSPEAPNSPSTVQPTKDGLNKVHQTLTPNKNSMVPINKLGSLNIGEEYKQRGMDFYAAILPEMSEPELKDGNKFRVQWFSSKSALGHSSYPTLEAASADVIEELGFELERADGSMDRFALVWEKDAKMSKKAWFDEPTSREPGGSPYPPNQNMADASAERDGKFEKTDDDITMSIITVLDGQDIAPFLEDDALLEDLLNMFPALGEPNKKLDRFCQGCPIEQEEKVAVGEPQEGKGQYTAPSGDIYDFKTVSTKKVAFPGYVGLCPNCKAFQPRKYDEEVICAICKYPIPPLMETHPTIDPPPGWKPDKSKTKVVLSFDKASINKINKDLAAAGFDGNGRGFTESYKIIVPLKEILAQGGLKITEEAEANLTEKLLQTLRDMENMSPRLEQTIQNLNLFLFALEDVGFADAVKNAKLSISWYPLTNIYDLEVLAYIAH